MFRAHPAGGTGAQHLRDRPQAVPGRRPERDRAAQRPDAAALRHGPAGASSWRSCSSSASGSGSARPSGGSSPEERAAAVGLLALPLAFGLHALVDYDLDFLAVTAPTALVSAALLAAGRPAAVARAGASSRAARSLAAVARSGCSRAPALSARAVDPAYRRAEAGDSPRRPPRRAARRASTPSHRSRSTHAPPSRRSRETTRRGGGLLRAGDAAAAREPCDLVRARHLPPARAGNQCGAYFAFNAAYTLDPKSSLFRRGARSTWRGPP